jgi:O-antigen/teichoic acid export membrane protein
MAGGNLLATLIGILGSLVQARYVTPADLGYFRGFSIATGYAFFFHLGILDVLQRLYPYHIGRKENGRALAVAEVSQSWMVLVTIVVSGCFFVLAVLSLASGNWRAMLGWLVQAVAMSGFIYGGYLGATYRSGHDFVSISKGSVFSSIFGLFILPMFLVWPYVALAVRSCAGSLLSLVYLHVNRPLRIPWRFSWREWFTLLKQGFPIFVASYGAGTLWSVVEASIILKKLGTVSLGLWSLSFMILEMANKVPQSVIAVYTPRIMESIGRTGSVAECLRVFVKPMAWGVPVTFIMVLGSYGVLPFVVPILMPKYIAAIPAMCLMLLTLPLIILEMPYSLQVALGKISQQNISVYFGLGSFLVLAFIAEKIGMGLTGVVGASLLGRFFRILTTYYFVYNHWVAEKSNGPKTN